MNEVRFQTRAQTKLKDNLRVTAAVLSAEESEAVFDVSLYKKGIQPVWLEIENKDAAPTWFLPFSVDPDYFSPLEVTYLFHRTFDRRYNDRLDRYFLNHAMGIYLTPGTTRSGFVFTNLDLGTKSFNVDLVGKDNQPKTFTFFITVPGLIADHRSVAFESLYAGAERIHIKETDLRTTLENLPCCAKNKDGAQGLINLVLVGSGDDLLRILLRSGWNETASSFQESDLISDVPEGSRYIPLSPLVYFDRPQDAAFSKSRPTGTGRNVLRLWISPMRVGQVPVWVGSVARESGLQWPSFSAREVDLDEMRSFFIQDLWYAQGIKKYGFVKAAGIPKTQRSNKFFEDISYTTDGYRAVLWVSEESIPLNAVEALYWAIPPVR
jgi:hypothetical protein